MATGEEEESRVKVLLDFLFALLLYIHRARLPSVFFFLIQSQILAYLYFNTYLKKICDRIPKFFNVLQFGSFQQKLRFSFS